MTLYRVKQFYWAITSPFRKVDKDYIEKHLTKEEMRLFYRLTKGEILHCVRVARAAGLYYDELIEEGEQLSFSKEDIIRLSLLHDVGKIKIPINVVQKSIIVILHKLTKGRLKRYSNFKHVYIYYNHPREGLQLLNKDNYSEDFLDAVASHHHKSEGTDSMMLRVLRYADNIS